MSGSIDRVTLAGPDDVGGFWRQALALDADGRPPESVIFDDGIAPPDLFAASPPSALFAPPSTDRRPAGPAGRVVVDGSASIINVMPAKAGIHDQPLGHAGGAPAGAKTAAREHSPEARTPPPAALVTLADRMLLHRDPERFALCYRLLRRIRAAPHLLQIASNRDVARAHDMARSVRRDMHKMTAFVRFREVVDESGDPAFVAWFEPDHHIVAATAPFFVRRFAGMRWSILTPGKCAHWNGSDLVLTPGASRADAPAGDPVEEIWRTYYAHIFNPARLKVKAMQAEMPKKYWRNLPEAALIAPLIQSAAARRDAMIAAAPTVAQRKPGAGRKREGGCMTTMLDAVAALGTLPGLAAAEARCQRCPLYRNATQVVPGEGRVDAPLMIVGEQPGDQEDIAGRPFVGPAGKVLDAALERVGIPRGDAFVTNAVKHFKFAPRGKSRLHQKPDNSEIDICRWWLDLEREIVKPRLIVALGVSAARGILGRTVTIGATRGKVIDLDGGSHGLVTVHPSYLLRIQDEADKRTQWNAFLDDLRTAKSWLDQAA